MYNLEQVLYSRILKRMVEENATLVEFIDTDGLWDKIWKDMQKGDNIDLDRNFSVTKDTGSRGGGGVGTVYKNKKKVGRFTSDKKGYHVKGNVFNTFGEVKRYFDRG